MKLKTTSLLLLLAANLFAQKITKKTVDISLKQQVYSQRISKNYILKLTNQNFDDFKTNIDKDKISSDRQLGNLYLLTNDIQNLRKNLNTQKKGWVNLYKTIQINTSNDIEKKIKETLKKSKKLLKETISTTKSLEKQNDNARTYLVKDIKEQTVLSQRLCLYYTAMHVFNNSTYKRDYRTTQKELKKIISEMNFSINKLVKMNFTSETTKNKVDKIYNIFKTIKALDLKMTNNTTLELVYKTTNQLLNENNKLSYLIHKTAQN